MFCVEERKMSKDLGIVKIGLALVLTGLLFGVGLGISFGINESGYKDFIAEGIANHPQLHDGKSNDKIWRYVQRAHFHATGIAAFSLGLIALVIFSGLKAGYKAASSVLIGLSSFYPLSWFTMFLLAPSIGRGPAHEHLLTEAFVYVGVSGLMAGMFLLFANLFLGFFGEGTVT